MITRVGGKLGRFLSYFVKFYLQLRAADTQQHLLRGQHRNYLKITCKYPKKASFLLLAVNMTSFLRPVMCLPVMPISWTCWRWTWCRRWECRRRWSQPPAFGRSRGIYCSNSTGIVWINIIINWCSYDVRKKCRISFSLALSRSSPALWYFLNAKTIKIENVNHETVVSQTVAIKTK